MAGVPVGPAVHQVIPHPAKLSWRQVAAWRARRHHLDARVPRASMLDVVGRIGGLHAQVMSSAELSLSARVEGLGRDDVATALWRDRTLVKTWAMRGTLHLLPTAEYPLWQGALSRYRHYERPAWLRGFGLTGEELAQLLAAAAAALDVGPLTRLELAAAVAARTGSAELGEKVGGSWGSLLKPLAYRGELCFASSVGRNIRFARPRRWLGSALDPEQAAIEVTRRFLAAYGPASREDYAHWWGGLSPAAAGRLIAALGDEVATVEVAGKPAFILAEHVDDAVGAAPVRSVRLLPAFDPYVINASPHAQHLLPGLRGPNAVAGLRGPNAVAGLRGPNAVVAGEFRSRVYRSQGWLTPVLAVDGRFEGVWRHERKGTRVLVRVEPFVALPAWARRGVDAEAARLADLLGGSLELELGSD